MPAPEQSEFDDPSISVGRERRDERFIPGKWFQEVMRFVQI
jgi:hypothetical protein